jgi:hypothetical protein
MTDSLDKLSTSIPFKRGACLANPRKSKKKNSSLFRENASDGNFRTS